MKHSITTILRKNAIHLGAVIVGYLVIGTAISTFSMLSCVIGAFIIERCLTSAFVQQLGIDFYRFVKKEFAIIHLKVTKTNTQEEESPEENRQPANNQA